MDQRDEFSNSTKALLSRRVGTLCSNPTCSVPTYGPSDDPGKSSSRGVAAHVAAARKGGPRYDCSMTSEERSAPANGLWLCENCAKIIDTDEARFSKAVLLNWKQRAEDRARKALENPRVVNFGSDFADTLLLVAIQRFAPSLRVTAPPAGKRWRRRVTIHPLQASRQLLDVKIPIVQDSQFLRPGECLVTLSCQNQGIGMDQFVKVDLRFQASAIRRVEVPNPDLFQLRSGGKPTSSYASFLIRELLPRENVHGLIVAKDGISLTAALSSQNRSDSPEVHIFEVTTGQDELVDAPIEFWKK